MDATKMKSRPASGSAFDSLAWERLVSATAAARVTVSEQPGQNQSSAGNQTERARLGYTGNSIRVRRIRPVYARSAIVRVIQSEIDTAVAPGYSERRTQRDVNTWQTWREHPIVSGTRVNPSAAIYRWVVRNAAGAGRRKNTCRVSESGYESKSPCAAGNTASSLQTESLARGSHASRYHSWASNPDHGEYAVVVGEQQRCQVSRAAEGGAEPIESGNGLAGGKDIAVIDVDLADGNIGGGTGCRRGSLICDGASPALGKEEGENQREKYCQPNDNTQV